MSLPNYQSFIIDIPVKKINRVFLLIILLNILLLFGTWLDNSRVIASKSYTIQTFLAQFNFAKENVGAAWYSSMLLLLVGLMAVLCFIMDMNRFVKPTDKILNYGWLLVAMIFILLSFDEMGSFHEIIGETALFKKMGNSKSGGWYAFYALIGLVALFMISFFLMKFKDNKWAFFLTVFAVLLFVSNPFQEKYEIYTWRHSPNPRLWQRPSFFLLLEEGSEILASFCFLYSFVLYSISIPSKSAKNTLEKGLSITLKLKTNIIFYILGLIGLAGVTMLLVKFNAWHLKRGDNGIPQNWFPSIMSFVTFLYSLYLFFIAEKESKSFFLSIIFISLSTSIFFGCDMYEYKGSFLSKIPYLFLLLTIIAGTTALIKLRGLKARVLTAAWILFMALALFNKGFYPALFGYIASSILLITFFLYHRAMQENIGFKNV